MKRLFILVFILTSLQADDYWSGCGSDKTQAKNNLAENILVKIESKVSTQTSSSFTFGFENFTNSSTSQSQATSTLILTDLEEYAGKDAQTCVKVSKQKLESFTKENISKININYNLKDIKGNVKEQAHSVDEWLKSLKFLKGLSEVFKDLDQEVVNKKISELKELRKTLANQYVKINITGSQIVTGSAIKEFTKRFLSAPSILKIDHTAYDFSKEIYIKHGKHTFSITGEHCKISQEFELTNGEDKTISINLDDYSYPKLVITANKDNVSLKVDGDIHTLGKTISFEKCSGSINYTLTYTDGEPSKISDTFTLEPGFDESYTYNSFLSNTEINKLNALVSSFEKAKRLELTYNYANTDSSVVGGSKLSNMHQFGASYLTYSDWLRHGIRANIGIGEKNSYSIEATYMTALQLTTFGADKNSLRFSNFAVIVPYVGIEFGLGYANIYNSGTNDYQNSFKDNSSVVDDNVVIKPLVGFDAVVSDQIAIGFEVSKSLTMQKSYNLGLHLSLLLN